MKTKPCVVTVLVVWLAISPSVATAGVVLTTFDTDVEGWGSNTPDQISWASDGGNPGGYLRFTDAGGTDTHVLAPSSYLGDWSQYHTEWISFDHKVFATGSVANRLGYRIEIAGPGGTATWGGGDVADVTDWVTVEAQLAETSWQVTEGAWSLILKDVTEFKIGIEVFSNWGTSGEICGIDNVALVPEPCTVVLLGLGALPLLKRRKP